MLLNPITQGTDYNQRIGRVVNLQSLEINATVDLDVADSFTGNVKTRLLLVYDKQTNGAIPTWNSIMETTGGVHALKRVTNENRFIILRDKLFTQSQQGDLDAISNRQD